METDSGDQRPSILDTRGQRKFDDFLQQIEEEQKYIDMKLFEKYFSDGRPDEMLQDLYDSKSKIDNRDKLVLIHHHFDYIAKKVEKMPTSKNKNEIVKMFNIVNEIFKFNEQIRWGQGLKILTPNQMLSRIPVSLAQLKAGNDSEKLKNKIRQPLHSLYRSKKLTKQFYKSLIDII